MKEILRHDEEHGSLPMTFLEFLLSPEYAGKLTGTTAEQIMQFFLSEGYASSQGLHVKEEHLKRWGL